MALVTQFLTGIRGFIVSQNGDGLSDWLQVDPAGSDMYHGLRGELKQSFPARSQALDNLIEKCLPEEDDVPDGRGSPWPGFVSFMKEYLQYWRDANFDDMADIHEKLCGLLTSCSTALANPTYGVIMFKTSISLSEALSKVVMILNRRPELSSGRRKIVGDEDSKSVVETSADIIQKIFTSCLTDRTSTRYAPPAGKKIGVYIFANLTLKLLFTCGKSRLAVQLLTNISTSGPPLSLFPASQRVTFLYYLGRFNFDSDNFLRAAVALQEAYNQTPPNFERHRRLILTYLIPSNIMLGRFPTEMLLSRPEAQTLGPIFSPVIAAVQDGNFLKFQEALSNHGDWLYRKGILLTFTYRLRPLLWRTFTRKVFMITYDPPEGQNSRAAATLNLADVVTAASYIQKRLEGYVKANPAHRSRPPHINTLFMKAVSNNVADADSTLVPPPGGPKKLRPSEGLFWGNLPASIKEVEGVVANLIAQGFMHGFLAHSSGRFAVMGAKQKGPIVAGWPTITQVILDRMQEEGVDLESVPGWVKEQQF